MFLEKTTKLIPLIPVVSRNRNKSIEADLPEPKTSLIRSKAFTPLRLDLLCSSVDLEKIRRSKRFLTRKCGSISSKLMPELDQSNLGQSKNGTQNIELTDLKDILTYESSRIIDEKYSGLLENVGRLEKELEQHQEFVKSISSPKKSSPKKGRPSFRTSTRLSALNGFNDFVLDVIKEDQRELKKTLIIPKLKISTQNISSEGSQMGRPRASSQAMNPHSASNFENIPKIMTEITPGLNSPRKSNTNTSTSYSPSKSSPQKQISSSRSNFKRSCFDGDEFVRKTPFTLNPLFNGKDEPPKASLPSQDWYLNGKVKFLSKKVFPNAFEDELEGCTLEDVQTKGICADKNCTKCKLFKTYVRALKKYTKTKDIKQRSKIMHFLSNLENRMLYPKFLLNKEHSKGNQKGFSVPAPCLAQNNSRMSERKRLVSIESSDQKTKESSKLSDSNKLELNDSIPPLNSSSNFVSKDTEKSIRFVTSSFKKKIIKNIKRKNMNLTYTSCNIKI